MKITKKKCLTCGKEFQTLQFEDYAISKFCDDCAPKRD